MSQVQTPIPHIQNQKSGPKQIRRGPLVSGLIILCALLLAGWLEFGGQTSKTDPTQPGHPLSNKENHLHTIVQGDQPGRIYLGTHFGIFTSDDGGSHWPQLRGDLNQLMVTSIAVNTQNADHLGIITLHTGDLSMKDGIYFSGDHGRSWQPHSPQGLPSSAYPFLIRAGSANDQDFYVFYVYAGWYETQDQGQHWQHLTIPNLSSIQTPAFLMDPSNSHHLLIGGDQGLYETRDQGRSWKQLSEIHGSVLSLNATDPTTSGVRTVYCSTDQGLFRWRDDNHSRPQQLQARGYPSESLGRLIVSPDGKQLYGTTGQTLWVSEDAGQSWTRRWNFNRPDLTALVVDHYQGQSLYAGFLTPGLVLKSEDGGRSWKTVS